MKTLKRHSLTDFDIQSPATLVLTEENWRNEILGMSLPPRVKSLLIQAMWAWKGRSKISQYPQIDPEDFEEVVTRHVSEIVFGQRTLVLELRQNRNNRHLCLRRTSKK